VIKDAWAERFWTVIVFKDAAARSATEGLSFSLLFGLVYLRSKMLLTGDADARSRGFFFCRRHACHYSAAGFMHRKRLTIDAMIKRNTKSQLRRRTPRNRRQEGLLAGHAATQTIGLPLQSCG
jgi:hypothetical protein